MADLVLDIATLRGAIQLLRGEPRADEGQLIDLDIAALGTLVEAICFYDGVLVPDLEHHLGARLVGEAGDAVAHVPLTSAERATIVTDALDWVHRHCDLDLLIELLGVRPARGYGTWGSDDFLLLQAVGAEGKQESAVVQAIRAEDDPSDDVVSRSDFRSKSPLVPQKYKNKDGVHSAPRLDQILDQKFQLPPGPKGVPKGMSYAHHWLVDPKLRRFAANLAWALMRSRCYLLWANSQGSPYMPHPLRSQMAGYAAAVADSPWEFIHHSEREKFVRLYLERIDEVHWEARQALAEIEGTGLLRVPFPTILPYVIGRAGAREDILAVAYELRDSRGAKSLRHRLADFEGQIAAGDLRAAIRLRDELDLLSRRLRQDMGLVGQREVATTLSIGLPGISVEFPGPRAPSSLPAKTAAIADRVRRPWLVFMRNVFDALASASSLGNLYEVLYTEKAPED